MIEMDFRNKTEKPKALKEDYKRMLKDKIAGGKYLKLTLVPYFS